MNDLDPSSASFVLDGRGLTGEGRDANEEQGERGRKGERCKELMRDRDGGEWDP